MTRILSRASTAAAILALAASAATAQTSPPTFQGDRDVYKVIFEDANFRVIAATWKKGAQDKPHSHPVPSVVYSLDDCRFRLHSADGATRELATERATAMAVPITPSHSAENISAADCHAIFVERK
jgi:quercetin dioxygenase-like cupin family protein